jgi:hypothetical protein
VVLGEWGKGELELRFAALTIDWNIGMLEKWNVGMAPFGPINACGGGQEAPVLPPSALTNNT